MASLGINLPDEVRNRLDGYRERVMRQSGLYCEPSRSSVITQAIVEFLNRRQEPEKQVKDEVGVAEPVK